MREDLEGDAAVMGAMFRSDSMDTLATKDLFGESPIAPSPQPDGYVGEPPKAPSPQPDGYVGDSPKAPSPQPDGYVGASPEAPSGVESPTASTIEDNENSSRDQFQTPQKQMIPSVNTSPQGAPTRNMESGASVANQKPKPKKAPKAEAKPKPRASAQKKASAKPKAKSKAKATAHKSRVLDEVEKKLHSVFWLNDFMILCKIYTLHQSAFINFISYITICVEHIPFKCDLHTCVL